MSATIEPVRTETGDVLAGRWQDQIDVRDFIQANVTPYTGDAAFLAGPTGRTRALWSRLTAMFPDERARGVYDVDARTPASISSHAPGYIDREQELIVGRQTDAPLRRAIMPNGGLRMVEGGLAAYGYTLDPSVREIFSRYRRTHNDGVFDAYPADVLAARRAHVITGLPDAYGRGRIIGDYRRVPLYGTGRLVAAKRAEKAALDARPSTAEIIRDREELAEQIRALGELAEMAASYGCDVTRPAATAREAIQWLYLAYLAAVKEQNGAAMSLGRTSTFLDVYLERDRRAGRLTETGAQELVDDFVIKLRIVRFLRTPEYDQLFSGDPTWVTESIGGIGRDGRPLVTRTSFRYLQTLYNLGPAPEPNLTVLWSPALPEGFKRFCAQVSIDTSSIQYESDDLLRARWGDDTGIAGLSVTADSLAAIRYATVHPVRDETGLVIDYRTDGEFPVYGNDDDRADDIAVWLVRTLMDKVRRHETYRGAVHTQSVLTITSNVVYGKHTGSTPDGRRAGQPFAPGANPMNGRDQHGLVAAALSVAKLPYSHAEDGISLTQTITPDALGRTPAERVGNLVGILDGYVACGGFHMNVNVLDRATLLDAMDHPERYPQLTIRVSGYAVNFVRLTREQQLDVVSRTFHRSV